MEIRRGYVKWTDEDGVFHKEPLYDHPDLMADASPADQLAAEELRRLNEEGERRMAEYEKDAEDETLEALRVLKAAPEEILTAAQLEVRGGKVVVAEPAPSQEESAPAPSPRTHGEPVKVASKGDDDSND